MCQTARDTDDEYLQIEDYYRNLSSDESCESSVSDGIPDDTCEFCAEDPCVWIQYQQEMYEYVEAMWGAETLDAVDQSSRRRQLYKQMAHNQWGHLGAKKRRKHPKCVEDGIRGMLPSPNGSYMGFHRK